MVTRADPPRRFRVKDEAAVVRFNTAQGGSWNHFSPSPAGSATATLVPLSEMSHDGNQVVRVDLSDACTNLYIGISTGKSITLPNDWNGEFGAVFNIANNYQALTFTSVLLNDAAVTAAWAKSQAISGWKYNGWRHLRWRMNGVGGQRTANNGTPAGQPPSFFNACRLRLQKTAGAGTACSIYVALMGVPAKSRPQVMLTFDGATVGQYTNLWPVAKAKKVPIIIGCQSDDIAGSTGTHMSPANLQEMNTDPSGLAELYVYSKLNNSTNVGTLGETTYLANYDIATAYLKSLGVKDPNLFHPYPLGDYTDTLMNSLMARGVKIARLAGGNGFRMNDVAGVFSGKQMLAMDITVGLTASTVSVAQARASVDEALMNNENIILLCHQVNPAGNSALPGWPVDWWEQLIDYLKLKEKQGLCDITGAKAFVNRLSNPRY